MEQHNQPELIEATENSKKTILESVKNRLISMSKKTMILLSVGILTLATVGVVLAEVYDSKIDAFGNQIERQVGIKDEEDKNRQEVLATVSSSSSAGTTTKSVSELAETYGVKLVDTSDIAGTYTAKDGNDRFSLVIKGNQATLTEVDDDGEQTIDQVIFDLDKKLAYIDGQVNTYSLTGSTLVITEVDNNDTTLDKMTFTKQ